MCQSLSRFRRGLDCLATGSPARRLHTLLRLPTGILIRSLPLAQPSAFPSRSLLPTNSGLRARRSELSTASRRPEWH